MNATDKVFAHSAYRRKVRGLSDDAIEGIVSECLFLMDAKATACRKKKVT